MRHAARRRAAAGLGVVLAAALTAAGCGPGGGGAAAGSPTSTTRAQPAPSADESLVEQAGLAPCPEVRHKPAATKGDALPVVTLPCLGEGPAVPLSGLRGPLVLNLWATWCGPCREEAPLFQRLHAAGDRVTVIGVDTKDRSPDAALSFAADHELHYPSLYDEEGRVLAAVKAGTGLPVTLFLDEAGRIVHRRIGPYTSYGELTSDVRKYLKVRP